ncbi:MAG: 2-oxoacid:acceptor oxidoreductase family protein [Oscillospiraceae bacterium]
MGARIEFRLSGSGGQGVISAGIILAAAAVHDGKHAIQSQSYGPEARGGASKAEVVISNESIDYPKATTPDYVLCLTNEAFRLYGKTADPKTVIFVDSEVDIADSDKKVIRVPIIQAAHEINPQGANVVAVGFLVGYTKVVTREATVESLNEQFPKFVEKNMKCVEAGFKFADDLL